MARGYDPVTKALHWLVFVAVAAQYAVGEFMPHIGRNAQDTGLIALHMSLGASVLAFIVIAIGWRLVHPVLQLFELPGWQRVAATLAHWALYLLILAMTLLGWAATDYRGWPVKVLGLIPLPDIAQKGDRCAHMHGHQPQQDVHQQAVDVACGM